MKCKQCGWDNPDNYERCFKCGNVLIRPRTDQGYAPNYVTDRTPTGYSGIDPAADYQRPYSAQPYNDQPTASQPYSGRPHAAQPYDDLPYTGRQPYNNKQPYNDNVRPSYPDVRPSQPRQTFSPPYGQPQYDGYPLKDQYIAPQEPQAVPKSEAPAEEHYCPECDAELPAGATVCPACGTKIEIVTETIVVVDGVCPDCGTEVMPIQKLCHNCGASLAAREDKAPGAPQPAPQPISRPVSQPASQPASQPMAQPYRQPVEEMFAAQEERPSAAGADFSASNKAEDVDDTVAAGPLSAQIPGCELRMVVASGEKASAVRCTGDEVELYRGNTDPANNTIARDLQARLTFADGKWSIEDCSALQTTFIRPVRKMELRDGDVIVMGNREFIFKA